MSKAFRFHEFGGPEVLRWEDVEIGDPGPGQVRLRHTAIAVNFRDVYVRRGPHEIKSFPSGVGIESAGVIEALGPGVAGLSVGDRVACVAGPDNAYGEGRLVPAARVVPLPAAIDDRLAAAMMIRGMTARFLVRETWPVKPGDTILVHAAAGGVGLILCQWANYLGATVIGTVSSRAKADTALAHGCHHAIVYGEEDFVPRVKELTQGRGVDVVYESVGKDTFEGSLHSVRRRGMVISFGEASGAPEPVPPKRLGPLGSIYLTHPGLPDYTATREELLATVDDLFTMVRDGHIRIGINHTYALKDAPLAHRDLEERRTTGSTILVVD